MRLSLCNSPMRHDKGYAWLVLLASFLLQLMIDGILSSYGFIHPSMTVEYENATTSQLILPGALQSGFYQTGAALSAVLVNRFGMNVVASVGSIISCLSITASAYMSNLPAFTCFFGACCGIGLSFMYVPAIISVNLYFKRLRPFASGLAMTGSGFGYILIPLMMKYLVLAYGWRDSLKITGGIFSICFFSAICLRPFVEEVETPKTDEELNDPPEKEEEKRRFTCGNVGDLTLKDNLEVPPEDKRNCYSSMPTLLLTSSILHQPSKSENHLNQLSQQKSLDVTLVLPLSRKDIFYSGLLGDIPLSSSDNTSEFDTDNPPDDSIKRQNGGLLSVLLKSFDIKLFNDLEFVLLVVMAILTQLSYFIPFVYLIDYSRKTRNLTEHHLTYLALGLGISSTVGRVIGGLLANLRQLHPLHLSFASLSLCGISSLSVPFCTDVYLLLMYAAVQGFALAVTSVMQPLLLVKYIGINRLTNAFGNMTMLKGFASFSGAPMAALLYELTGRYSSVFLWAGGCFMAALIPHIPFYVKMCQRLRDDSRSNTESVTI